MLTTPNLREDDATATEGILLQTDAVALNLTDDDVARAIGNRVNFGKSWWNKTENLETVQKRAENIWLGLVSADVDLYDYQEPYEENRIFVAIETLISQALGRPPQPIVESGYDTDASRSLAQTVEKILLAYYHNLYQRSQLEMIARHLLTGFRYGVLKYRFDPAIGRKKEDGSRAGGIVTEVVRPDKIVFDAGATDKDNIPLIAEYMQASSDELCYRYPDKQNEIMTEVGKTYGVKTELTDLSTYLEVHFTGYMPDNGEEYEGVAVKFNKIVLDKFKNPNYNYDEFGQGTNGDTVHLNFFDKPKKPYVVFNFLNQGKYIVDSTSLTEQTRQLQRHLEKRGRQIDENADLANSGFVFNSSMVTEEKVAKLIGDPDEKLMVKGDVTKAAARLPANKLEDYVIGDKVDIRGAIDTIFGANAPLKGDKSGNETLGQDVLSVQRNTSRLGVLVTALENGMDRVYKGEVQLMKVFFTDEDIIKYTGPEGNTEHIPFSSASIEPNIGIIVKEGSLLPDDPATKLQIAQQFEPILDPLSIANAMQVDDPKKTAKQIFLFKADPGQYGQDYLGINQQGNFDQNAVNTIQQISQGQPAQVPENPSNSYVAQINSHMGSPEFKKMNPVAQAALKSHAQQLIARAKQQLGQPTDSQQTVGNPPTLQQNQPGILGKFAQAAKAGISKTLFQ